jgi:hypothetical protein
MWNLLSVNLHFRLPFQSQRKKKNIFSKHTTAWNNAKKDFTFGRSFEKQKFLRRTRYHNTFQSIERSKKLKNPRFIKGPSTYILYICKHLTTKVYFLSCMGETMHISDMTRCFEILDIFFWNLSCLKMLCHVSLLFIFLGVCQLSQLSQL